MMNWRQFLIRWSKDLMGTELSAQVIPPPDSPDWLGFPPATKNEISELEHRLGVLLPPSYKAFLSTTNGWRQTTFAINKIRPATEVEWFKVENEQWVEIYSESGSTLKNKQYFDYNQGAGASDYRAKHMKSLLQISDVHDGVYLLNPEVVTPDGEWEAWFFANWIPGAMRFPSFAHLMLHEYQMFAQQQKVNYTGFELPVLSIPAPDILRIPAKRIHKNKPKSPALEILLEQLRTPDEKQRLKVIRTLGGKLKGRNGTDPKPHLVPLLNDLYYTSPDFNVRAMCVSFLTELAPDGEPPKPLLDALSDPEPGVVLAGIFALTYFPNPHALEPLCIFIDSSINVLFAESAMSQLGQIGDERAVPTLARVLLDIDNKFDQSFGTAAIALAGCGNKGFEVLEKAVTHNDARIRFAAVVGLDVSGDPRAFATLDKMKNDPDPKVKQRANYRTGKFLLYQNRNL